MLAATPRHQSSGCCSDHRGRGVDSESSVVALLTTSPSRLIRSDLAPVVEISIPRNRLIELIHQHLFSFAADGICLRQECQEVERRPNCLKLLRRKNLCFIAEERESMRAWPVGVRTKSRTRVPSRVAPFATRIVRAPGCRRCSAQAEKSTQK